MRRDLRTRLLRLMLVGITALFAGCSIGAGCETPPQSGAGATRSDARSGTPLEDIVQFTIDTLPQLAGGMPLGAWKREHAADTIEAHAPRLAVPPNEHWCARATSPPSGPAISTRVAYFYPPASGRPSKPSPEAPTDECRLGLLWTDIEGTNAGALAVAAQQVMVNTLGDPDPPVALQWPGSADWSHTAHWRIGRMSIVTGISQERTSSAGRAPRVIVAAAGEASRLRFDPGP